MKSAYTKNYFQKRDILIHHLAESIKKILQDNKFKSALDVGCGGGQLTNFLKKNGFDSYGCDNSKEALKIARKTNGNRAILNSPATKLPFSNNSFDFVSAISLIEHLNQKEALQFLLEAKRILKPNGKIFLVTPNFHTPLRVFSGKNWFAYKDPTHIAFYTPKTLSSLLVKSGFSNPKTTFYVPYSNKIDREFPNFFQILPTNLKRLLLYLMFKSPLSIIRDSFWISAEKND